MVDSVQFADTRKQPIDIQGKMRVAYFYYKNETGSALAANTVINLCRLPKGTVRILPGLSRYSASAFGTGRTIDIGHEAYVKSAPSTTEAADVDALLDGASVATAVAGIALGTAIKFDIYSTSGVIITAKVLGDTMPTNATFEGFITYVQS